MAHAAPMIRRLRADDQAAYAAVRLRGLELHPEAFGTGAADWKAGTPEQVRRSLEGGPDDVALGAFVDGALVGLVGLKREPKSSVRHKGTIWGFFVDPAQRRAGHGGALLAQVVEVARTLDGLTYVRALVTATSVAALKVFEAAGFTRYGLEEGGIQVDGQGFDQVYLRLELSPSARRS
jgi:ribosomal protein S18 acetylase RimI-like enzyme